MQFEANSEIAINKYPFFLWLYRHKEAKIDANTCQSIVNEQIVENRLIPAHKWEVYLLRYAPVFLLLLLNGWNIGSYGSVGFLFGGAIFLAFLFYVDGCAKRFLPFSIGISSFLLVAGLYFDIGAYANFIVQYSIAFIIGYYVLRIIEISEWQRYRRVAKRIGLYVVLPETKKQRAHKTEKYAVHFAISVTLIGLLGSAYHLYQYRETQKKQQTSFREFQKKLQAQGQQPQATVVRQTVLKKPKSVEEQQADAVLGTSR